MEKYLSNNTFLSNKPQGTSFKAGLTRKIAEEIRSTNVAAITDNLQKRGMQIEFKDNKIVAWSCNQALSYLELLKKKFGQKFSLPNGIFVEDFNNLKLKPKDKDARGFSNWLPCRIVKDSNKIYKEKTLFFSELIPNSTQDEVFNYIDKVADKRYKAGIAPTDHFLYDYFHEFFHPAHEEQLLKKLGIKNFVKVLQEYEKPEVIFEFQKKYGGQLSGICSYAATSPFEAVACDMSKIALSTQDFNLKSNPFKNSPYAITSFLDRFGLKNKTQNPNPLSGILKDFWNGKF